MSGSSRKRNSKWDSKEEYALAGKPGISFHEKESPRDLLSPEASGVNRSKWSGVEPMLVRRGSNRDDNIDDDRKRTFKSMTTWDADDGYGIRMSPGLEDWRQQNHRYSPKSEWKRSRRSRSRSHSRSRSRSRSPVHGFRREAGIYDRNRSRSTLSAQLCKDFASGRCRRGSHCHFLHEGSQSYEDSWERHGKTMPSRYATTNDSRDYPVGFGKSSDICNEFIKGNCRRGASCRFVHQGTPSVPGKEPGNEMVGEKDNDRRHYRYPSPERHSERESRRVADVPCKFFAAGNCRNGKFCRFSHNDEARLSPERRARDGRWPPVQISDHVEKPRTSSKWSDVNISMESGNMAVDKNDRADATKSVGSAWSADDRWNPVMDGTKTLNNSLVNNTAFEGDKKRNSQWKTENVRDNAHISEHRGTDIWHGDMNSYPEWNYSVQRSDPTDKECSSLPNYDSSMTQEASGQMHDTPVVLPSRVNETSSIQRDYYVKDVGSSALLGNDKVVSGNSHLNISANISAIEGFNQISQNSNALPVSLTNMVAQNQATVSADPSRVRNILPENQMLVQEVKSTANRGIEEAVVFQGRSDIPVTQNIVNTEHLTQLTTLSASLAQLLANGQKLPQLYAAHNTQNGTEIPSLTNLEEPIKADSTVINPPSHALAHQKPYDSISDIIEPSKHDGECNPSGFDQNLTGKNGTADGMLESKNNDKSHLTGQPELGVNSEATKEENGVRGDGSEKAKEENKTIHDSGQAENFDGDVKADESKKGKDLKGNRAFKFALVESVKELLKPKWKEGQMSKDAYKNIVKKVVDKVTGTMQGTHIPQTQEKIEQYLSVSKPKLTKLIQAYVEKFQKDK